MTFPKYIQCMRPDTLKPSNIDKIINNPLWILETKHNGTRALIFKQDNNVVIMGRKWVNDYADRYPEVVEDVRKLSIDNCILDTELTFFLPNGKDKFVNALSLEENKKGYTVVCMVFDVISINNVDLRETKTPLFKRIELRNKLIPDNLKHLKAIQSFPASKERYMSIISKGFEGVVFKRKESLYEKTYDNLIDKNYHTDSWLKLKRTDTEDCIVIGCTKGEGERSSTFGSLLLAQYNKGKLVYVGKTSGFTQNKLNYFNTKLAKLSIPYPPISNVPSNNVKHWCKPSIIIEVKYDRKTEYGILYAPRFVRERTDKSIKDCGF